jgi:hypothetical protein
MIPIRIVTDLGRTVVYLGLFSAALACNGQEPRAAEDQEVSFVESPATPMDCDSMPAQAPLSTPYAAAVGNIITFGAQRQHQLLVTGKLQGGGAGNNIATIEITELAGTLAGATIVPRNAQGNPVNIGPNTAWAILILDSSNCSLAQGVPATATPVIARREQTGQHVSRASIVDQANQRVYSIIRGASSYILASN